MKKDSQRGETRLPVPLPAFRAEETQRRSAAAVLIFSLLGLLSAVLFTLLLLAAGLKAMENGADRFFLREVFGSFLHTAPASVLYGVDGAAENLDTEAGDVMPEEQEPGAAAEGDVQVVFRDLSAASLPGVTNRTSYQPDYDALLALASDTETPAELYAAYGKSAPVVLIVHTHGTESYRAEDCLTGQAGDDYRSEDPSENIVAVGDTLAEVLVAAGINTMHCTVMFDKESYAGAYAESAAVIKQLTERYPSIRYVLDVHRDALIENGENSAAVTEIGGVSMAQFMMVVGTDEGGADHPRWKRCLAVALQLQSGLGEDYRGLVRNISLRPASFNAQYAPISLLMEFGTCGNTLAEAKRTAVLVAAQLAELISGEAFPVSTADFLARLS